MRVVCLVLSSQCPSYFDVRTVAPPEEGEHQVEGTKHDQEEDTIASAAAAAATVPDPNERDVDARGSTLDHHLLELHREGEKTPPPRVGEGGGGPIGTLSCATLVYAEKNWRTEVSP